MGRMASTCREAGRAPSKSCPSKITRCSGRLKISADPVFSAFPARTTMFPLLGRRSCSRISTPKLRARSPEKSHRCSPSCPPDGTVRLSLPRPRPSAPSSLGSGLPVCPRGRACCPSRR